MNVQTGMLTSAPAAAEVVESNGGAPQKGRGVHVHDGLYLRLAAGVGGASWAGNLKSNSGASDGAGADSSGFAIPTEVSVGWTPAPGLVLGLGTYASTWPSPHTTVRNYGRTLEGDTGNALFASLGPFVDYYLNPEKGLHAEASVGLATGSASKGATGQAFSGENFSGSGWSVMGGVGWETWIGEQWSAGVLGRVQYGSVTLKGDTAGDQVPASFLVLGVLGTVTYH